MIKLIILALFLVLPLPRQAHAASCTTGQTTCTTDTVNDDKIAAAVRDPAVQLRVYGLWLGQCQNIWSEAASTAGNVARSAFCKQIASGAVNKELLVAIIMNSTVQSEVLGCTVPLTSPPVIGYAAGCMVDVDVNTAISTAMTETTNSATTTATAASAAGSLTVASATGIAAGMSAAASGLAANTTVQGVSGTTVYVNPPTIAALSATPIIFSVSTGLP